MTCTYNNNNNIHNAYTEYRQAEYQSSIMLDRIYHTTTENLHIYIALIYEEKSLFEVSKNLPRNSVIKLQAII